MREMLRLRQRSLSTEKTYLIWNVVFPSLCLRRSSQVIASLRNLAISLLRMAGARYIPQALRACSRLGLRILRLIGLPLQL